MARSWGQKVVELAREGRSLPAWVDAFLVPGAHINPMAAVIAALVVIGFLVPPFAVFFDLVN